MAMAMATEKLHVCVFGTVLSIAITITKWVGSTTHFNNGTVAVAIAVGHHVNSLI